MTAELVLTLPTILLVIGLTIGAMSLQLERIKLLSTASDIARAIAREESPAVVDTLVMSLGTKVGFELLEDDGLVCVILKSDVKLLSFELTGLELIERQCVTAQGQ